MRDIKTFEAWWAETFPPTEVNYLDADPNKLAALREIARRAWIAARTSLARADLHIIADRLDQIPFTAGNLHARTCSTASTALREFYEATAP